MDTKHQYNYTSSTSRSFLKRPSVRLLPMSILRDSRSAALTPSPTEDRSKVKSPLWAAPYSANNVKCIICLVIASTSTHLLHFVTTNRSTARDTGHAHADFKVFLICNKFHLYEKVSRRKGTMLDGTRSPKRRQNQGNCSTTRSKPQYVNSPIRLRAWNFD